MQIRETLPERSNVFAFEHKPSEVNYGGKTRFHQVAFPPNSEDPNSSFETAVVIAVHRYVQIVLERSAKPSYPNLKNRSFGFSQSGLDVREISGLLMEKQADFLDSYYDQLCAIPVFDFKKYQQWVTQELFGLTQLYRQLRLNAIGQEKFADIPRLGYFSALACTTVIAEIISEYFEKQVTQLSTVAAMARFSIGRNFAIAFQAVETSEAIKRADAETSAGYPSDEAVIRLLNPFLLSFGNASDSGMIEEILAGPNPYRISHTMRSQMQSFFQQALGKKPCFSVRNLAASMAEPTAWHMLLQKRQTRQAMLKLLWKNSESRTRLVYENALFRLQRLLREGISLIEHPDEIMDFISNERQQEELLLKSNLQKRLLKQLRNQESQHTDQLKQFMKQAVRKIKRSQKRWLGRLRTAQLFEELRATTSRFCGLASHARDFELVRQQYGRDTNQAIQWQGLKVWRLEEINMSQYDTRAQERKIHNNIWEKRKAEIQNHFEEGNLFLCRLRGELYPRETQRRNRVVFLFADLRNSTETTMKLNKDTASYLTPYLTAVNKSAIKNHGSRIYFAGDGYAAYYHKILDAIRAAFIITEQFHRLQKISGESYLREAKEIFQLAMRVAPDLRKPKKLRQLLQQQVCDASDPKVREFITALAEQEFDTIPEESLKEILAKIAMSYSMPRIDVGIALTNGELFIALVNDEAVESSEKIPIVISPQLTQAARLSGSSDIVKNHIETKFPQPFPYNVYTWDQKLYNRGIVITEPLFLQIQEETEVKSVAVADARFKEAKLFAYYDQELQRRIILRENQEPVLLKGIAQPCKVYEVATMSSVLDKAFGISPAGTATHEA